MLESLLLKNVGPAAEMAMEFGPRLNLITGDNGLGKSFILDVAWWVLTRTWAGHRVIPNHASEHATIKYQYTKKTQGSFAFTSAFDRSREAWVGKQARPAIPGLVLYAQVDGGFSVWDPARNYWRDESTTRPAAYLFSPGEVWEGNPYCEGLIRDWASWQRERGPMLGLLNKVLRALSPAGERLTSGELRKISTEDPKRYPTLRMPYGDDVPVVFASAGMRRIIALGYLLVWAWQEHTAAAQLRGEAPAQEIIFLIDEIEAHLHPQWQRRIVPALLNVVRELIGKSSSRVQLIAATHSPLVLASAEPLFDPSKDAWFDLDLEDRKVILRKREFVRLGAVGSWLTSSAFDLREARSLEAEEALSEAMALVKQQKPSQSDVKRVDKLLRGSLGETDRHWVRWSEFKRTYKKQRTKE